ncbi:L,D-transpeptidase [Herbidospora cretacea]|uniref:L,D-transpeptidase n=1 Tax=Herbidospora cretacea TaxID=28444 RepID=UPI001FE156FA|nr:Ig-like domain-containing protein [Herbidospora cretacea]
MPRLFFLFTALITLVGCSPVTALTPVGVAISPSLGETRAVPDRGLTIRAVGGVLKSVVVTAAGQNVPGRFNREKTEWRSSWTLRPGTDHLVSAVTSDRRVSGRFRTLMGTAPTPPKVDPLPGETVGVGMPIVVTFPVPVPDRAAVERALEVVPDRPVEGGWHWFSDTQVVWRPRYYWQPGTRVRFTAHLTGLRFAPNVYGTTDPTATFVIGRSMTSLIDTRTFRMTVHRDGVPVQDMPISAGMATTREYTTTSGVHLTMEKKEKVRMVAPRRKPGDPEYYDLMIDHAVRISNSGEYVHAKDNLWAQGRLNVSHGCVNARPDQAKWFFDNSLRGDPVVIVGTDRPLEPANGWGFWQLAWNDWKAGSTLSS